MDCAQYSAKGEEARCCVRLVDSLGTCVEQYATQSLTNQQNNEQEVDYRILHVAADGEQNNRPADGETSNSE